MILQRIFLGIQPCFFAHRISQSIMFRSVVHLCDDITHVRSWMINLKTNMMWETFHKQDSKKKQTLKYLADCTLDPKFILQQVNGKSAQCHSLFRKLMCWWFKNSKFPPLSKFPIWLMMNWLLLVDSFAVPTTVIASCGSLASYRTSRVSLAQVIDCFVVWLNLSCDLFSFIWMKNGKIMRIRMQL